MEPVEEQGQWWLPESPERKVAGTLVISAEGTATLHLIGALRTQLESGESKTENGTTTVSFTESSIEKAGILPRILGLAGSQGYTLEDCLQTSRRGGIFGGPETQQVRANQVFRGVHFESGEGLQFQKIYVWMEWLAYWTMQTGLKEPIEFRTSEDGIEQHSATTVKITPIPAQHCVGQSGAVVTLGQTYGVAGDGVVERRLTQDLSFSVAMPTLVGLTNLLEQVSDLQDLVTIGTGRTAAHTKLELRHPDVVREGKTQKHELPIAMYAAWQVVSDESRQKALTRHDMFFSLADLGGMGGVEKWLAVAGANRSALGRVMATRYQRSMFVSDRVFNCAAALEAYDRDKHGDSVTFAGRLTRSAALAGEPFQALVDDVDLWVKALKDARNDVAHHKASMGASSNEHLFLSPFAYWLFVLCLLREASAPSAVFDQITQHAQFRWLQRRLREVLPPAQASGS